jgi:hypothetical protein
MIDKENYRYSNVELLDILKNERDKSKRQKAEYKFESLNLTLEQKTELEYEYIKYIKNLNDRKDKPLTDEEWFSFFFLPFLTPNHYWRNDHFTDSEAERFEKYGFFKKAKQSEKVRVYGIIFWFIIFTISILILNY